MLADSMMAPLFEEATGNWHGYMLRANRMHKFRINEKTNTMAALGSMEVQTCQPASAGSRSLILEIWVLQSALGISILLARARQPLRRLPLLRHGDRQITL